MGMVHGDLEMRGVKNPADFPWIGDEQWG